MMFTNTSSQQQWSPISCNLGGGNPTNESLFYQVTFWTTIVIAVLSPVAVVGNALILAAILKKTFRRTPFHILLSGLVITDLCTGLIAQPFIAAGNFIFLKQPRLVCTRPTFLFVVAGMATGSTTYFISITVLLMTLMSVERWLHMTRRSLVTSRRGYLTITTVLLLPIPPVVLRCFFEDLGETYEREVYIIIMTMALVCFFITGLSYFNVNRIICLHQQQVQANATSQNFGQPAINLAKYKNSVISILYILLLFSICFLPYVVSIVVYLFLGERIELVVAFTVSLLLLFMSSSLNPGLYLWRMNDIRNGVKRLF